MTAHAHSAPARAATSTLLKPCTRNRQRARRARVRVLSAPTSATQLLAQAPRADHGGDVAAHALQVDRAHELEQLLALGGGQPARVALGLAHELREPPALGGRQVVAEPGDDE